MFQVVGVTKEGQVFAKKGSIWQKLEDVSGGMRQVAVADRKIIGKIVFLSFHFGATATYVYICFSQPQNNFLFYENHDCQEY